MAEVGELFALNGIGILGMGLVSPSIANRFGLSVWLRVGAGLICFAGLLLFVTHLVWPNSSLSVILPVLMTTTAIGIIRPTASAGAMRLVDRKIAGSAASLFNFASFIGGGVSTLTISFLPLSVNTLAGLIFVFGLFAILFAYSTAIKFTKTNERSLKLTGA
ncbi:hypothetical protein BGC07_09940 [Piscirickettsia litoralis]|uniref:Major facilitator superfamily (MFS) profile domain-containing protein n=1 Tax=Piscirickettsia litoralis TaxID=1891921 RepID=A0ABX3A6A3_9GAMM|nr:hypothetical protein BGC07_09940 [Piscirickettsia litoralis]